MRHSWARPGHRSLPMSPELLPSSARTSKTHGAIYAALLSSFGMLERLEHLLDAPR
jgi:hypothetical protein